MLPFILLLSSVSCIYQIVFVKGNDVPSNVELGGAIVAAVEQDVEDIASERLNDEFNLSEFWHYLKSDDVDFVTLERLLRATVEGRGKFHKRHKMLKYLYPLLVGIAIAKTIMIPLLFKMLTALSTSSFVMSKIALLASGLLIFKWLFTETTSKGTHEHLQIIHLPPVLKTNKGFGTEASGGDLRDMYYSGSRLVGAKANKQANKYIPLPMVAAANSFMAAAAGGGGGGKGSIKNNVGIPNVFRYPQNSYNYVTAFDGKPFL